MRNTILFVISAAAIWAQQQPADMSPNDAFQRLRQFADQQQKLTDLQAQAAAIQAQIATTEARLDDLRTRYTDSHPDVKRLAAILDVLRAQEYKIEASMKRLPRESASDSPKLALPDRWWRNPVTAQYLALTADQQQKMDEVVQQFRGKLAVETVELQKQEHDMQPLVSAERLDEAKITAQIDRAAEARAELEKTNGRMLLGIRKLLTPEQWSRLNQAFTLNLTQ